MSHKIQDNPQSKNNKGIKARADQINKSHRKKMRAAVMTIANHPAATQSLSQDRATLHLQSTQRLKRQVSTHVHRKALIGKTESDIQRLNYSAQLHKFI